MASVIKTYTCTQANFPAGPWVQQDETPSDDIYDGASTVTVNSNIASGGLTDMAAGTYKVACTRTDTTAGYTESERSNVLPDGEYLTISSAAATLTDTLRATGYASAQTSYVQIPTVADNTMVIIGIHTVEESAIPTSVKAGCDTSGNGGTSATFWKVCGTGTGASGSDTEVASWGVHLYGCFLATGGTNVVVWVSFGATAYNHAISVATVTGSNASGKGNISASKPGSGLAKTGPITPSANGSILLAFYQGTDPGEAFTAYSGNTADEELRSGGDAMFVAHYGSGLPYQSTLDTSERTVGCSTTLGDSTYVALILAEVKPG